MINPISPQFVYIIHKDKERELMRQIEAARTAKERRAYEAGGSLENKRTWYAQASQWMKEKFSNRASESKRAGSRPEMFEEPCPVVPCS